jgi:pimeloyl-ACP methyl ester carboxylesterase
VRGLRFPISCRIREQQAALAQRQAFPSAQVELLEGHGHWVMLEDPERIAALVIPFLRSQLPSARS